MAIISFSRLYATYGDEIAERTAHKLGYKLITGTDINNRILSLGFPKDKIQYFNGKAPTFFRTITKEYEMYSNYLVTAILNYAQEGNCIFLGQGTFRILAEFSNHLSFFITSPMEERVRKTSREKNMNIHKAGLKVIKEDNTRKKLHKKYLGIDFTDPTFYNLTINAPENKVNSIADMLTMLINTFSTDERESEGKQQLETRIMLQNMTNLLLFTYELPIMELKLSLEGKTVIMNGLADSTALSERAETLVKTDMQGFDVKSKIKCVQDFKVMRG